MLHWCCVVTVKGVVAAAFPAGLGTVVDTLPATARLPFLARPLVVERALVHAGVLQSDAARCGYRPWAACHGSGNWRKVLDSNQCAPGGTTV